MSVVIEGRYYSVRLEATVEPHQPEGPDRHVSARSGFVWMPGDDRNDEWVRNLYSTAVHDVLGLIELAVHDLEAERRRDIMGRVRPK